MRGKWTLFLLLMLGVLFINGCGSDADGLNGSVAVTASATGTTITATGTYTNPTNTNLIGTPISFAVQIGNQVFPLGNFNTNNSGSVSVVFTPPPFNGAQTITVIATVDKLTNFATVQMSGRSLAFTPPVSLNLSTTVDPTLTKQIPFQLPATPTFIALTDPFTADLSGFTFSIQDVVVSTGGVGDTLTLNATTTSTNTGGTASFPGASGLITVPTTIGGTTTMTITWTVTDSTGLTGTGVTTVILTKTA